MRFRHRDVFITAEQWWPGKMVDGVVLHRRENPLANGPSHYFAVHTGAGWVPPNPGDYIVVHEDGGISVCEANKLLREYEPCEGGL